MSPESFKESFWLLFGLYLGTSYSSTLSDGWRCSVIVLGKQFRERSLEILRYLDEQESFHRELLRDYKRRKCLNLKGFTKVHANILPFAGQTRTSFEGKMKENAQIALNDED